MKLMKYSNIVYALMIDSYTLNSSCVCTVCILLSRTSYSLKGCQRATEKGTLQEVEMEFGIDYESEFTPTSSAASQVNTIKMIQRQHHILKKCFTIAQTLQEEVEGRP